MKKENKTINRKKKGINQNNGIKVIVFKEGVLEGITLCTTEEYQKIAYPNGNTDVQMMNDIYASKPSGKTIFDVGTFIGASSLVFSKFVGKTGKVVGFEPNPFNMDRISLNMQRNKEFSKNISIYPYALGKIDENLKMTLSSEIDNGFSSTSRLEGTHPKLHNSDLPEGFEEISVEVKKLDTFLKENKFRPDIIKVDIEGAEYDFLLGALETLRKYKPILYIEIHSEYCAIRCYELLSLEGYSVTIINEEQDNRIMIKAEHSKRKEKMSDTKNLSLAMDKLDSTFRFLNIANNQIEELTKTVRIFNGRIVGLETEKTDLIKSRNDLEKEINKLKEEQRLFMNSKSWKMTNLLHKIIHIFKRK